MDVVCDLTLRGRRRADTTDPRGRCGVIGPGTGVRVYLACCVTDMRKGIAGLSTLAQDVLRQKPASGAVFAFRRTPR
ncbi:IS66 family insertion sequence element accessory protein TnpB [Phaeobacter inhibens]